MPDLKAIKGLWEIVTRLGVRTQLSALLYPYVREYRDGAFAGGGYAGGLLTRGTPQPAGVKLHVRGAPLRGLGALLRRRRKNPAAGQDALFPGRVLAYQWHTPHPGQPNPQLVVTCENAVVQLTVLAQDLVRVRASPTGRFSEPFSYAVERKDQEWPPVECTLEETEQALIIRTARLHAQITKSDLRISFLDPDGTIIHTDAAGIGWQEKAGRVLVWSHLPATVHCYGLGEKTLPLDKRGHATELWNRDPASYAPGEDPIYSNIPFLLGLDEGTARGYGLFYDHTAWSTLDLGAQTPDIARFEVEIAPRSERDELRYYFFYGPKLSTVLERYAELTGRMVMPPLWALGYHQCRWSYGTAARALEIAHEFRQRRIPCEAIHLDIDYMDGYRCFTWNKKHFPDPVQLVADLHEQGYKVVTMIDPGIKVDRGYWVYEEGLEQDVFCTYPDGSRFVGPVWPGQCCFPDYTSPRVRAWWGELYRALVDVGIDGFWNDMNEPAVFGHGTTTMANTVQHEWEGHGAAHREAHNVYGMQMARATVEGLARLRPNERPMVISRSVWAGSQRYNLNWLGDNRSDWASLRNVLPLALNMGLSGMPFTGPDTGGFFGTPDDELLVRWNQLSTFTPLFRNHTSTGTGDQEPWCLGPDCEGISRAYIELRYRLLPYLYTAFWQAAQTGMPMMRPLFLTFQDERYTHSLEDEYLLGDAFLVAPITEAGRTARQAYLPPGRWVDFWDDTLTAGPQIRQLQAPLERLPLLVRAGSVVPAWPLMQHTGEQRVDRLMLHVYPGSGESVLYEDDGLSWEFREGVYRQTRFQMHTEWAEGLSGPARIRIERTHEGSYLPEYERTANGRTRFVLHGLPSPPTQVLVDGEALLDGHEPPAAHRRAAHRPPAYGPHAHLCPGLARPSHPPFVFETETFGIIEIQV